MKSLSEANFVDPYKLIGFAALSVDSAIIFFTFAYREAKTTFSAP